MSNFKIDSFRLNLYNGDIGNIWRSILEIIYFVLFLYILKV